MMAADQVSFAARGVCNRGYANEVTLDFLRPGNPRDYGFIEAFHSKLRVECLNANWVMSLAAAGEKLDAWRRDYSVVRPNSAIGNKAPITLAKSGDITSLSP